MLRRLACSALAVLALLPLAPSRAEDAAPQPPPAAAPPEAAAKRLPGDTWYAQALARGNAGLNVTHFWAKGPWLRAETVVAGHKVVNIVKGSWYYAYDDLTKQGLAIRRDPEAEKLDAPTRRPFGREYEILTGQGAELIREEVVLGRKAGVYRVTDSRGRRELWVTQDETRLPLRLVIYDRRSTDQMVTDYVNWQSGIDLPDRFFDPEASVTMTRMTLAEYLTKSVNEGPQGPVPVLYADLLHAKKTE
jgi:hypothetical protein